jgi:hypothetical protein
VEPHRPPDDGSGVVQSAAGDRSIAIVQAAVLDANLGTTSIYLQGIDPEEILAAVGARRAPMMSANAGLRF